MSGNPVKANQVYFWQRGRKLLGWIGKSTPTRYRIDYKKVSGQKHYSHVWRRKDGVQFVTTGKKGSVKRPRKPENPCPWPARKNVSRQAITRAAKLSRRFHGFRPRRVTNVRLTWPKALILLGHVVRLDYLSDKKDGKPCIYTHDFQQPVELFASGEAKSGQKNLLHLRGKFTITERGIVG